MNKDYADMTIIYYIFSFLKNGENVPPIPSTKLVITYV